MHGDAVACELENHDEQFCTADGSVNIMCSVLNTVELTMCMFYAYMFMHRLKSVLLYEDTVQF